MKTTLLIAEDEAVLREVLTRNFREDGYHVHDVADGASALQYAREKPLDLIVLDIMMPKMNGYDVCRTLRNEGNRVPVIMLTARGESDNRIEGFECGADDYVVKPFVIEELRKRIEAVLRRTRPAPEDYITHGKWHFDFVCWYATYEHTPVPFTRKELEMLQMLLVADGAPVSRDEFLDRLWPPDTYPTTRTIDTHVLALRKKLACDKSIRIVSEHGYGYKLLRTS